MIETYDAIIIGAGQAGNPLSTTLARAGWKTALIEKQHIGGTCVNEGCTPTKTMVASARVAHLARRAADYGVQTGPVWIDMTKVRQRKRDIVSSFSGGSQRRIERTEGVSLMWGSARFVGHKTLEVQLNSGGTQQLTADTILINAGARPVIPTLPGLETIPYLTSTTIMELGEVPEHLLVLGGGYIGLEFGQMFRRFGAEVTIIQRSGHLLGREDVDVAEAVVDILRQDGISVLLDSVAVKVERGENGRILFTVRTPEGEKVLTGSHLLLATGRQSNADLLNVAATGLAVDKRHAILVNEKLETNIPGIYALGDINGGPSFTHISYDDFRILRANLLEGGSLTTAGRMVPYTVFIDPQLGRIGLTEQEAQAKGLNYRVAKIPMNYVARALETDETRGFMKAVVDEDSKQILGAAILGIEGGEIATVLQVAMMGGVPYTTLRDAVFSHPTLSESLNNLFTAV